MVVSAMMMIVAGIASLLLHQHLDGVSHVRSLLIVFDADCGDSEGFRKLVDIAPSLLREFEAILADPASNASHRGGLYRVIWAAKIDPSRFLKFALLDLSHPDARVRHNASDFARVAGGGPEFAAPLLMMILHNLANSAAGSAMRALGKVGDTGTIVALEHLIRFGSGKQETPKRAKEVAEAFGKTLDEIKARLAAAKLAPPEL